MASSRSVTKFEGQSFAEIHNMIFMETSALEKVNVARAFQSILTGMWHSFLSIQGLKTCFSDLAFFPSPDIFDVSLQYGSTGVKDVLDDDDPNFKFDATSGKVLVLTPEMMDDGNKAQKQAGYCAC